MSTSSSLCLTDLPAEILEQILLHLPGQDIVKMEAISRQFRDLTYSSPALQYRRELFAAGLIDNPHNHCDLDERRRLCGEYVSRWSDATIIEESFRDIPLEEPFSDWNFTKILGKNLLASPLHDSNDIKFLRVPSARSGEQTEQWCIQFPFMVLRYTAYPPEDILVVAESKEGLVQLHLLNLDGSPYRVPPLNIITWEIPQGALQSFLIDLIMTGSRLMLRVYYVDACKPGDKRVWRVIVWDWKTGDLVFDLSDTDESGAIAFDYQIDFLDEFRIVITHGSRTTDLFVFDTLIPQGHPGNFRRFMLPWKYLEPTIRINLDHDRSLGMVNRDRPFVVDPTQDIFIVDFLICDRWVFLILRKQLVIGYASSEPADVRIPWNEWGKDAVVMDMPVGHTIPYAIVHGNHMLGIGCERGHQIHIFDFSRKGIAGLPFWDESGDRTWRWAEFEDGFMFGRDEELDPWKPCSLGDSAALSSGPHPDPSKLVMRVLDLM